MPCVIRPTFIAFFFSANLNLLSFLKDMILFSRGPVGGPVATGRHSRRFLHLGSLNFGIKP
jgi:hypothetical protein